MDKARDTSIPAMRSSEASAPMVSFVVPCRNVASYVDECLRSILDQSGAAIEVVAVDDASTDGTRRHLAVMADEDARLRLLERTKAGGPGAARNHGLAAARGRYVWFVDADDWLPPGSVAAVLDRLADSDPDVLILDHVRVYPSGRIAASEGRGWLATLEASPFDAAQQPDVTRVLHTPWNKVVRRRLLADAGIRFGPAPVYEDLTFSFAVLRAARRVVVLPRPCYAYRTGRPGALTRQRGPEHLAWAREWDIVLSSMQDDPPAIQAAAFARMVWHGWEVLSPRNGRRVPIRHRRRFHRRFATLFVRHRPPGARKSPPPPLRWWLLGEARVIASLSWWAARRAAGLMRYSFVKTTSVIPVGGPSSGAGG